MADEKNRKQKIVIWSVAIGLLLVLVFAAFVFKSLNTTRKQKQLIEIKNKETEEQKKVIEEKQKDILDSIHYAKRIQESILPTTSYLNSVSMSIQVLYKPRDIVSGDLYWVHKNNNGIYMAVIDCTGHGVPGGFMSILGYNGIQNAILDLKLRHPNEILDSLSKNLVTHFTQEGKQTLRDGMDMALCCMYEKENIVVNEIDKIREKSKKLAKLIIAEFAYCSILYFIYKCFLKQANTTDLIYLLLLVLLPLAFNIYLYFRSKKKKLSRITIPFTNLYRARI